MTTKKEPLFTSDMFTFYLFPLGRQQHTLRALGEAVVEVEDAFLRSKIADAIEFGRWARGLEIDWRGHQRVNDYGAAAQELDRELDRAVSALFALLNTTVESYGEASCRGSHAQHVLERLFPKGARPVTQLPFHEQDHTVSVLLERATTEPRLVAALRELDAGPLLRRLRTVHARFHRALPRKPSRAVTYEAVKAARREGHERLCVIVLLVQSLLVRGQVEGKQATKLETALREVLTQNQAIKRDHQRRRRSKNVEPDLDAELHEDEEDGELPDLNEADAA